MAQLSEMRIKNRVGWKGNNWGDDSIFDDGTMYQPVFKHASRIT